MAKCRVCGCTWDRACPAGCGWAREKKTPAEGPICTVCTDFKEELERYVEAASRVTRASLARLLAEVA